MLSLKLNRKSWHYKWARFLGWREMDTSYWPHVPNDFCSYLRRIILGTLFFAIFGAVGVAFLSTVIVGFFSFIWFALHGFDKIRTGLEPIGAITVFSITVISIIHGFKTGILHFRWLKFNLPSCEEIPLCEDTKRFFIATYQVVRNRMCFKLEFHNGEVNGTTGQNEGSGG